LLGNFLRFFLFREKNVGHGTKKTQSVEYKKTQGTEQKKKQKKVCLHRAFFLFRVWLSTRRNKKNAVNEKTQAV
jgi:hypothetical protein